MHTQRIYIRLPLRLFLIYTFIANTSFYILSANNYYLYKPFTQQWILDYPISHRGLYEAGIPENSLASFNNAINNNVSIELDVSLTKDNVVIVFHDTNTYRLTGQSFEVRKSTYNQIESLKLGNTSEKIPTLRDALAFINGQMPVVIDVKNTLLPGKLEEGIAEELNNYTGSVAIQSHNPFTVKWFRDNMPLIPTGIVFCKVFGLDDRHILNIRDNLFNWIARPNFVVYNVEILHNAHINKHRERGLIVIGFTLIESENGLIKHSKYSDNSIYAKAS